MMKVIFAVLTSLLFGACAKVDGVRWKISGEIPKIGNCFSVEKNADLPALILCDAVPAKLYGTAQVPLN